jgi:uncharacterized protein
MRKMITDLFTHRSVGDIIRDMDDAGVEKACIVPMDLTTHCGVELVTNEDVARIAAAHPERFIPFASVDPSMGRAAVDELNRAVKNLGAEV